MRLSASKIKTHRSCPAKFKFRYLDRVDATKAPNGYLELGTWVHETIENVLSERPDERNESALHSHLQQEFYRLESAGEIDTAPIDDDQRDRGTKCIEVAARFIADQADVTIRDLEPRCQYYVQAAGVEEYMSGYIDVTTDRGVWDWKTGRVREDTPIEEVIQGSVYMAGYRNLYDEMPDRIRFVYLNDEQVRDVDPSEANWQRMLRHARRLQDALNVSEFPADPEQSKCHFCQYAYQCPAAPASPAQLDAAIDERPELWDAI